MRLEKKSRCKVNLLLNILGQRADGFHEVETVMHPVNICDDLVFTDYKEGVQLTCSEPSLPTDGSNLVYRAAMAFREKARLSAGIRIHLQKRIPLAAGLGGGSGNAATTLLGLNEFFGYPLEPEQLRQIASSLGSDIPFFLQPCPALATGRGEKIQPFEFFAALKGMALLLIHPGFGISTAWAYHELARFPAASNGRPGRAQKLVADLQKGDLACAAAEFYNALEFPALEKYPLLAIYQEFLRAHGAATTLMSGSGSTTFAIIDGEAAGRQLEQKVKTRFGSCWTAVVPMV